MQIELTNQQVTDIIKAISVARCLADANLARFEATSQFVPDTYVLAAKWRDEVKAGGDAFFDALVTEKLRNTLQPATHPTPR